MPRVACPSCAKAYEVAEQSLGGRAQCKSCGETFTLSVARDETFSHRSPAGSGAAPLNAPVQAESGLVAGNQLGHYVLKKKLGAGGMGEVWLANDPHLERDVALKVLPVAIAHDDQRRERFAREARLAARLHHPNAVIVYQFGLEEQQVFIAMELVDGQSLDQVVQENGPLHWREATRVICDAAHGLAAAHDIGLVHRDIKPGNLMRTSKGETKVVDFGLAREQFADTQFTQEGMTLGTPAYMAPEQWSNEHVDGRTDLYSLICTYYYLLTGALPFEATNFAVLGYQHRYEPLPDPRQLRPDLPVRVTPILSRGAEKEPGDRYQTAAELVAELETLLEAPDQPVTARSSSAERSKSLATHTQKKVLDGVARVRAWKSTTQPRKRWTIAACVAAAVLLLLGIIVLIPTATGTVKIEIDDPTPTVIVDEEKIAVERLGEPIELRTGEHELIVRRGDVVVETRDFTIVKGEETLVNIKLLDDEVASNASAEPADQQAAPEPDEATDTPKPVPARNEPPVVASLPDQTVIVGEQVTMRVQASDPDDEDAVLRFSLLRPPTGATIDGKTGEFRWTPTAAQAGEKHQVTVEVADDGTPPGTHEQSFLITVTPPNRPPTLDALEDTLAMAGEELRLTAQATDTDGPTDRLRFSLLGERGGAKVDAKTGEFRWTPTAAQAGEKHQLTVQVADDGTPPETDQKSFVVTVMDPTVAGQVRNDNSLNMKLCWIPAGRFTMGSPEFEKSRRDDEKQVEVTLTRGFWLGKYEVTQGEWRTLLKTEPWKGVDIANRHVREGDRYPAILVSWEDAIEFCRNLTEQERGAGRLGRDEEYRLPTEAEWEYACRAGTDTAYSFGNDASLLGVYAWHGGYYARSSDGKLIRHEGNTEYERYAHEVGLKRENAWGLHDMYGNVYEWCQDVYVKQLPGGSDPVVTDGGSQRVQRGGSWDHAPWMCRSASRYTRVSSKFYDLGFRVARSLVK